MAKYEWLLKDDPPENLRPLPLPLLKVKRALTSILPGCWHYMRGLWIERTGNWREYHYRINAVELSLDQTVNVLMGTAPVPSAKAARRQDRSTRKLDTAPAPRVFPTAIDHSEVVPTVALALPLELEAA